ncbi:MAG: hypothetical protein M3P06_01005 [Acidobacteriota bacterium]|nr:hypothetical protein [Acidobacteriota bacterium]
MIPGWARVALGSFAGAAIASAIAPATKRFFAPPTGGVGWVTVNAYPKGWDYAVIALLVIGAFAGGALAQLSSPLSPLGGERARVRGGSRATWIVAIVVFVLMLFLHDHPYAHMDHFHEGEHLTAGWLMKSGERPYRDFFVFHGLAADAGLDAMVLGEPPSPLRPRRLQTILDAATVALLVPIAAELAATAAGMSLGVYASLCAIAALWLPVFPFYRMAPVLIAVLGMLRYARGGSVRALSMAMAASTLGVLWSLDTGTYALAGTIGTFVVLRLFRLEAKPLPLARVAVIFAIAMALPFLVLLAVRADIARFLVDSFVILPRAIDATWALAAPAKINAESLRYFLPPVFYGFLGALALLAWRRGERPLAARLIIVTIFSLLFFRTAVGRVGWSHTRFALPLLGIAVVAFVLEPLLLRRRWREGIVAAIVAVPLFFHLEIAQNTVAGAKLLAGWPARQRHDGMVRYPFATGRGLYTSEQNATDLASLKTFLESLGPAEAKILDFSNERALYYLLQRKPPLRTMEISMLSVPELLSEAMAQLNADPPIAVVLSGYSEIAAFDGVSNRDRVPELARWIDANYPVKTQVGRFLVAHRPPS